MIQGTACDIIDNTVGIFYMINPVMERSALAGLII